MQNNSTITPTTYIFHPEIPEELRIPIEADSVYIEGFGYFPKKLFEA